VSNVLDFQVSGAFPSKVGGAGATIKYFPRPIGPSIGVAPSTPSTTSAAGSLFLPAQNVFQGQQFNILASGFLGNDVSGDPSDTSTVVVQAVTGTFTAPVYTTIATLAVTPNFAIEPWGFNIELVGASKVGADGRLVGAYSAYKVGSVTAPTTITNVITGLDFNGGNAALQQGAVLGFVVGVTFSVSNAGSSATLTQFTVES
jgi:hypothetical protein